MLLVAVGKPWIIVGVVIEIGGQNNPIHAHPVFAHPEVERFKCAIIPLDRNSVLRSIAT